MIKSLGLAATATYRIYRLTIAPLAREIAENVIDIRTGRILHKIVRALIVDQSMFLVCTLNEQVG